MLNYKIYHFVVLLVVVMWLLVMFESHLQRESALKKKLGELSSDDIGSPGNATIIGSAAESPLWLSQEVSGLILHN